MPDNSFKEIKLILNNIVKKYGLDNYIKEEKLFNEWELIVGNSIAKYCTPKCVEDDTLFIAVKNNFWRKVISMKKEEILKLVSTYFNGNYIKKIKII